VEIDVEFLLNGAVTGGVITAGGLFVYTLFKIIVSKFFEGYGSRLGLIRADYDFKDMKAEVQGIIENTVQNVKHEFWQKQQIDQVRRIKIELLMNTVVEEQKYVEKAYIECLGSKSPVLIAHNHNIKILIDLYFSDLDRAYQKYLECFKATKDNCYDFTKDRNPLTIKENKSHSLADGLRFFPIFNSYGSGVQEFVIKISETAKGLTKFSDS